MLLASSENSGWKYSIFFIGENCYPFFLMIVSQANNDPALAVLLKLRQAPAVACFHVNTDSPFLCLKWVR